MSAPAPIINPWMMLPFAALLCLIMIGPGFFADWWQRHYAKPIVALTLITVGYYFLGLHAFARVGHAAREYFSFITLIGSLYVVSGGIHINVKGEATPLANVIFLLIGALLANLLGTTGASMLLIRPWFRMNKYRITAHHVVFFIFIVSNVGGCLTPIGDPPLFIGYLFGVPFWWVMQHCYPMWLVAMAMLLAMFYVVDSRNYRRAPKAVREQFTEHEGWRFQGLGNIVFLGIILAAVFLDRPAFLREGLMIGAAVVSYFFTGKKVHAANHFNFHPIEELAVLFIGIFGTMLPVLDWMENHASGFNGLSASFLYWGSGTLSSALDNAPTYVCFLKALLVQHSNPDVVAGVNQLIQAHGVGLAQISGAHAEQIRQAYLVLQKCHPEELAAQTINPQQIAMASLLSNPAANLGLVAISVGAVFFGANTYIGNGPNFMIKTIAHQQRINTPGFFRYLWAYTLPFMLPVLVVVWWLFFRGR